MNAQLRDLLKQVAIEEGQWGVKQDTADEQRELKVIMDHLNAGSDRVAKAKLEQDAAEAKAKTQPIVINREILGSVILDFREGGGAD